MSENGMMKKKINERETRNESISEKKDEKN